jgi:ABC-type lipoprotein release transport system permease subunit
VVGGYYGGRCRGCEHAEAGRCIEHRGPHGDGRDAALGSGASRLLESLLFEVSAWDVTTFAGVALLQVMVGAVACWLPAARAGRIDPAAALDED